MAADGQGRGTRVPSVHERQSTRLASAAMAASKPASSNTSKAKPSPAVSTSAAIAAVSDASTGKPLAAASAITSAKGSGMSIEESP